MNTFALLAFIFALLSFVGIVRVERLVKRILSKLNGETSSQGPHDKL